MSYPKQNGRIIGGKQHKLSALMYKLLSNMHYNAHNPFTSRWIQNMQDLFDRNGLSHIWINESEGLNDKYIKLALKQRLFNVNLQKWNNEVHTNSQYTLERGTRL